MLLPFCYSDFWSFCFTAVWDHCWDFCSTHHTWAIFLEAHSEGRGLLELKYKAQIKILILLACLFFVSLHPTAAFVIFLTQSWHLFFIRLKVKEAWGQTLWFFKLLCANLVMQITFETRLTSKWRSFSEQSSSGNSGLPKQNLQFPAPWSHVGHSHSKEGTCKESFVTFILLLGGHRLLVVKQKSDCCI